jgi:tellurite resistance protein
MDEHMLLEGVLRGVLGGRRKRSHRALSYLTGVRGGSFLSANTLLTAAGVAWGIFETMQNQPGASGPPMSTGPTTAPSAATGPVTPAPSLPNVGGATTVPEDALRMIRLAISAGSADGSIGEKERAAVLEQARAAGAEHLIDRELQQRRPLAEIVAGISNPAGRATLYVLAFGIIRADEAVSGAERIYLAQLASLLGLDPETVTRLEYEASTRIDSLKA